jgi:hypothetical protein
VLTRLRRRLLGAPAPLPDAAPALPRGDLSEVKLLVARTLEDRVRRSAPFPRLRDAEFRVFSQFGEDGILQYLIHACGVTEESFVEFGVEDYTEANTRYLLVQHNWRGLVMDGSEANVARIRSDAIYWRHDLTAVAAFIDRDNIDALIRDHGFAGDIGVLSVDIDGNDYWVWERIDCVRPVIVVAEYNALFGPRRAVTVPYDPGFQRGKAHYSHLYWGVSLKALCVLAERKGYRFVGCNSNGNNAFFVRADRVGELPTPTAEEGFVQSRFRESRDPQGRLTFVGGAERARLIADLPVYDVEEERTTRVAEL